MTEYSRPSKQFIIRGSIAVGIVAIVLVVQTDWFRSIFNKKPLPDVVPAETVGDLIVKDSNGNEIPDWEERLWGLDPTVLYTNGVPNKTIIEEKRNSLGVNAETEPQNETDALARQLLTITAAIGQSKEVTPETLSDVASKLADSIEFKEISNTYSLKDLSTIPTTSASLKTYYERMRMVSEKYSTDIAEMDLFIQSIETEDYSRLGTLLDIKKRYEQFARELTTVAAPIGLADLHLDLVNNINGIAASLGYLSELGTNSANAFAGVALYKVYDAQLTQTTIELEEYLKRYGIL